MWMKTPNGAVNLDRIARIEIDTDGVARFWASDNSSAPQAGYDFGTQADANTAIRRLTRAVDPDDA